MCLGKVDRFRFRFMVFNATFNNISVISWRSVLVMEETDVPIDLPQVTQAKNAQTLTF
jgi:hypothetical protein